MPKGHERKMRVISQEYRKEKYDAYKDIQGKTVLLSPFVYSVANLPVFVWEEIIKRLRPKGYCIIANINKNVETNPFEDFPEQEWQEHCRKLVNDVVESFA